MLGLAAEGIPVTWLPTVWNGRTPGGFEPFTGEDVGDPDLAPFCNRRIDYDTVIIHTAPELYSYFVEKEEGKRITGMTVWETDRLPEFWLPLIDQVEHIIVPCQWNKDVFLRSGVRRPVDVIPHILVDRSAVERSKSLGIRKGDYVFYTIGDWSPRKAVWKTVRAYLDAFTSRDPVVLVVKTSRLDETRFVKRRFLGRRIFLTHLSIFSLCRGYRQPARIKLIPRQISDGKINALHERGDCFVSLTNSEGWGLGAFDAAGAGNPVIMTGYGGQLDFLPPDLAYLVDFDIVPVVGGKFQRSYSNKQNWAAAKLDHASRLYRHVFENRAEARRKGRKLQEFARMNFSPKKVVSQLIEALS
ncbi:MAG TPA: hypothetical protein VMN57_14540 [Anaerolineales bacterium]|nr:hypothetical protein [Anaerolineales bacterium]